MNKEHLLIIIDIADGVEQEARGRSPETSSRSRRIGHPAGGDDAELEEETPGRDLGDVGANRTAQLA